jgi:hypothetical protein
MRALTRRPTECSSPYARTEASGPRQNLIPQGRQALHTHIQNCLRLPFGKSKRSITFATPPRDGALFDQIERSHRQCQRDDDAFQEMQPLLWRVES